jgi:ATP-dependent Clp protease ATP-binding subunit ClpC
MSRNPTLVALRNEALSLAKERKEVACTGHLLWALTQVNTPNNAGHASGTHSTSAAADLLSQRRISADIVKRGLRVASDDSSAAFDDCIKRAQGTLVRNPNTATRTAQANGYGTTQRGKPEVREIAHESLLLLSALCHDAKTAAVRILEQCGVDVARLRLVAMQTALGIVEPAPVRLLRPAAERLTPPVHSAPPPVTTNTKAPTPVPAASLAPGARTSSPTPGSTKQKSKRARAELSLPPKQFPMLAKVGVNLSERHANDQLEAVVGRDLEVERLLDILAKKHNNTPCLIGASGVGKTSVVHALVAKLAEEEPKTLVVEVSPSSLLQDTTLRGQLAEKFKQIRAELDRAKGSVVLFLDDLHGLLAPELGEEAASELKALLDRGDLRCLGATSTDEYQRTIERDASLARRFVSVEVEPLKRQDALLALSLVGPSLEAHHGVQIPSAVLETAIAWTMRYAPGRPLLDTAKQLIDHSAARAKRKRAATLSPSYLAEAAAELLHVPKERLLESDADRMLRFESLMHERVVGHTSEIEKIGRILRRNASGIVGKRPIGAFLLLGSTGVGKTETAKAVAATLFFSSDAMTRIDMSEYAEPHSIARLMGAPPGYVGFEAGGQLTEAVRKKPYQVLLLDEIEKAHQDVLEAFLQVLDEGRMTDGRGRTVDFTNTVIFATSNLGADVALKEEPAGIGFGRFPRPRGGAERESRVVTEARKMLRPEFFNRFDEALVFAPLSRTDMAQIAKQMVDSLSHNLEEARGITLHMDPQAIEHLLREGGFDPELGARPMRRAIARLVEAPVAELILRKQAEHGDTIRITVRDRALSLVVVGTQKATLHAQGATGSC